jgi:membrane protease YdiL (CAAX protease family)
MDTSRLRALLHDFVHAHPLASTTCSAGALPPERSIHRWIELGTLLLCGNGVSALAWRLHEPINTGPLTLLFALALYAYVGYASLGHRPRPRLHPRPVRQGVSWRQLAHHTAIAVGAGLALAASSLLFLLVSSALGGLSYSPIQTLSLWALLVRLVVEIPLLTAIVEELVFRHYLYRRFVAATVVRTVVFNAGIFVLWHLVVTWRTVTDTPYARHPALLVGAYLGALAAIMIGGAVFALVRQQTGGVAYSAITHWLAVALLTLGTWLM